MPFSPWVGELMLVSTDFAPKGWFPCNGALLPIAAFPGLYAVIGTVFGGDGVSTFALPNLAGRVPVGAGQGPGLQNYALGQTGGAAQVTLAQSQLPSHSHTVACNSQGADTAAPDGAVPATPAAALYAPQPDGTLFAGAMLTPSAAQPAVAHDNMQPYTTLQWVIAYQGDSPFSA